MNNFIKNTTVWLAIILMSFSAVAPSTASAAAPRKLDSYITYLINQKTIYGQKNIDKVLTIASVSKLFTSQWALDVLKPDFKFQVTVYTTPVHNKPGFWNVHLSSDYHPYFERALLDDIAEYLNRNGIKNIELLSFDEGVKYVPDVDVRHVKWGDLALDYPSLTTVKSNLRVMRRKTLSIKNIEYWGSRRTGMMGYRPIQGKTKFKSFYSDKLVNLLHRMNANSNNHAANQIFKKLGGADAYAKYAPKVFTFKKGQHVMLNGSGNPIMVNGKKQYGRSTSAMVVQVITFLYTYTKAYYKSSNGLSHVLAIAKQAQIEGENNTLGAYYNRAEVLKGRMIAKTGTTFDAITLAGVLSTAKGPMAFYFNIDIDSKSEAGNAVGEIRKYLVGITEYMGQGPVFK